VTVHQRIPGWAAIFQSNDVFETQKAMLKQCIDQRWRVMLLLSVPLEPQDGGVYGPPNADDAARWIAQFRGLAKQEGFATDQPMAAGALYWPWLQFQESVGAPVLEMPPSSYAAGIFARCDLARGPQVSPANETLEQVVGTTIAFGDEVHGRLYNPPPDLAGPVPSINVIRAFPGYGVQLWGARTLSTDTWLSFIAVRRALTAIEIRMKAALDLLVFEPNTPALWLQITHATLGVLLPMFESGAMRGSRPEEAFYVRCDGSVNTPEAIAAGQLFVEVGVAIAAPAEFIVFRLGRREGVVEVLE
jgi:phage tail sheath protein FI